MSIFSIATILGVEANKDRNMISARFTNTQHGLVSVSAISTKIDCIGNGRSL